MPESLIPARTFRAIVFQLGRDRFQGDFQFGGNSGRFHLAGIASNEFDFIFRKLLCHIIRRVPEPGISCF